MSTSIFAYGPLPQGKIRLLREIGVDSSGTLQYALECRRVADCDFYALSYVWGSDTTNHSIKCNGADLSVTESVYRALCALQQLPSVGKALLWIDAICINQNDVLTRISMKMVSIQKLTEVQIAEKEREVLRMDEVYQQAKQVLVWLGEEAQNSNIAMHYIESMSNILPKIEQPPDIEDLEKHGLPCAEHLVWPALGHLYRRTWFRRLWAFQEAVLSTSMKFICGELWVSGESFCLVGSELNRTRLFLHTLSNHVLKPVEDGFRVVANITWAKGFRQIVGDQLTREAAMDPDTDEGRMYSSKVAHIPFASLLMACQHAVCQDPRDHVYGIISLTSKDFRSKINISYSQDTLKLYTEVGRVCIAQDSSLTYLQMVVGKPRSTGLPSWCSDLSYSIDEVLPLPDHLRAGLSGGEVYQASTASFRVSHGIELMEVSGFRVDTVCSIVQPSGSFRFGPVIERRKRRQTWLIDCLKLAQSVSGYVHDNNEMLPAHAYAVTANTITRVPDSSALWQAYEDFMQNEVLAIEGKPTNQLAGDRNALYSDTTDQIFRTCSGRAYFTTSKGRIGIGPPDMRPGDIVVVIYGARPVFILREHLLCARFEFVGDAFVHGLMELHRMQEEEIGKDETFCIM